ncbi:MAG: DUF1064 domain-containing protein [Endomicrobium sp.]|jgi:hypothetical protein|nr:DUF1064 domain-containing protein [Endomicrobium sp.]
MRRFRRSKYGNVKVIIDGHTFDSKAEGNRYCELKLMQKSGLINYLTLQPKYLLIPKNKKNRAAYYIGDFLYVDCEAGKTVVEDVKGFETKEFRLKKKMFEQMYHAVELRIIKHKSKRQIAEEEAKAWEKKIESLKRGNKNA